MFGGEGGFEEYSEDEEDYEGDGYMPPPGGLGGSGYGPGGYSAGVHLGGYGPGGNPGGYGYGFGSHGYFAHLSGGGVTLGGSGAQATGVEDASAVTGGWGGSGFESNASPNSADIMAARLKKFALRSDSPVAAKQTRESSVACSSNTSPPVFVLSPTDVHNLMDMGFAREDVERSLYASLGDCTLAAEYLVNGDIPQEALQNIPTASSTGSSSSLPPATGLECESSSSSSASPSHSAIATPESERAREISLAKERKRREQLDRKRLRLEIERDREERRRCGGKLPATHEALFSKGALELVNSYAAPPPPPARAAVERGAMDLMDEAFSRIGDKSINSSTSAVQAALSVVAKILQNIDEHPEDEKYRSINTGGKVYKEKLSRVVGVKALFHALGFKVCTDTAAGSSRLYLEHVAIELVREARSRLFILQEQIGEK